MAYLAVIMMIVGIPMLMGGCLAALDASPTHTRPGSLVIGGGVLDVGGASLWLLADIRKSVKAMREHLVPNAPKDD